MHISDLPLGPKWRKKEINQTPQKKDKKGPPKYIKKSIYNPWQVMIACKKKIKT